MLVSIIDVGNTHTKIGHFRVVCGKVDIYDYEQFSTPRESPHALLSLLKDKVPRDRTVMINSFSGAFIYGDEWYFADKDVEVFDPQLDEHQYWGNSHELNYLYTGQNNRFGLVGLPSLLMSTPDDVDKPPETPHGWLLRQLFMVDPHWDVTHASRSGLYNLHARRWCVLPQELESKRAVRQLKKLPVFSPAKSVGHYSRLICAGGLDHSFVSTYLSGSYVASGTWCNIVQVEPDFNPNLDASKVGIRWGILADGRMAKELVFPVEKADENVFRTIREALPLMNMTSSVAITGGSASKTKAMLEDKVRLFYELEGGHPHLEMKSAAYYAWRASQ